MTTSATTDDPWGESFNVEPVVNSSGMEAQLSLSADGLSLYFGDANPFGRSPRAGGVGGFDIWVTTRPTRDNDWSEPINLGPPINSQWHEEFPCISADGLEFYFCSKRSGKMRIWVTTRQTESDDWTEPVNLGSTVNAGWSGCPNILADGRTLLFRSDQPGGYGGLDIWMTTRAAKDRPWSAPVNLGPKINTANTEGWPCISADGSTLYFSRNDRPGFSGNWSIWQVSIEPVVDLNGDSIVDAADMCVMVDHWGTDEPLCDIGPMPWGDGVVDVEDLIVLAEHLFEEYPLSE
jgi:Tol biopolymer transport system component